MKTLHIQKNFLSKSECDYLIEFYNQNIENSYQYRNTFPLDTEKFLNITDKIESICYDLNQSAMLQTHQIVKWPQESYMDFHRDPPNDIFASIIYLNDDYEGGETIIEDIQVKPETGKLVLFSNSELLHCVNKIKKGTRYTLAAWFVSK